MNNLRTTSAECINLHTIRNLIKCFLKNVPVKVLFTVTILEILLFEGQSVLPPVHLGTRSETVNNNKGGSSTIITILVRISRNNNGKTLHNLLKTVTHTKLHEIFASESCES